MILTSIFKIICSWHAMTWHAKKGTLIISGDHEGAPCKRKAFTLPNSIQGALLLTIPILYIGCNFLSMLKLNLIHVSKGAPCVCFNENFNIDVVIVMGIMQIFCLGKISECECTHMHCELCYWIMRIYSYSVAIEHITCSFWKGMYVYNTFYKFRFLSCFVLLWYVVNNNSWCD